MSESLATLLVGFGNVADGLGNDPRMARYFEYGSHAQVLAAHPGFRWLAVVDPSPAARERAAGFWSVPHVAADVSKLPSEVTAGVQVLVLATPPPRDPGLLDRFPALRAVVLEKPLGMGLKDAEQFVAACARRQLLVQVPYWRRAVAGFVLLAKGDLSQRIGRLQSAFGVYGGGLRNNGSHLVDFVRMLFGEVRDARAVGVARLAEDAPHRGDVRVPFVLELTSGASVMVQSVDFRHYREVGLDAWGTAGRLTILQESLAVRAYPVDENRGLTGALEVASDRGEVIDCSPARAFYELYDNLAVALQGKARLCSPATSALDNERILETILLSAATLPRPGAEAVTVH